MLLTGSPGLWKIVGVVTPDTRKISVTKHTGDDFIRIQLRSDRQITMYFKMNNKGSRGWMDRGKMDDGHTIMMLDSVYFDQLLFNKKLCLKFYNLSYLVLEIFVLNWETKYIYFEALLDEYNNLWPNAHLFII